MHIGDLNLGKIVCACIICPRPPDLLTWRPLFYKLHVLTLGMLLGSTKLPSTSILSFTHIHVLAIYPRSSVSARRIGAPLVGVRGQTLALSSDCLVCLVRRDLMVFQGSAVQFLFGSLGCLVLGVTTLTFLLDFGLVAFSPFFPFAFLYFDLLVWGFPPPPCIAWAV